MAHEEIIFLLILDILNNTLAHEADGERKPGVETILLSGSQHTSVLDMSSTWIIYKSTDLAD